MRFLATFTFILSLVNISSFFNIAIAMSADELEEHFPRASRSNHRKHAVKSNCCCSCVGCCSGCCKKDSRCKVDPDDEDNRVHAFITAYFPKAKEWYRGSASIISDNCLITAGHCLYYGGEYASEVIVVFGMNQVTKCGCFSRCKETKFTSKAILSKPVFAVHPDYLRDPDSCHDLAILSLKSPSLDAFAAARVDASRYISWNEEQDAVKIISLRGNYTYGADGSYSIGDQYGVLGLGGCALESLRGAAITITGYPARVRSCNTKYDMYSASGRIHYVRESLMLHDTDTSEGDSGAGICISTGDGEIEIIGVQTGEYNESYNQAVLFSPSDRSFIAQHLNAFDPDWATVNLFVPAEL